MQNRHWMTTGIKRAPTTHEGDVATETLVHPLETRVTADRLAAFRDTGGLNVAQVAQRLDAVFGILGQVECEGLRAGLAVDADQCR